MNFAFVRMLSCVWNACRYINKPTGWYVWAGNTGSGSYSGVFDKPNQYWHLLCFALFVSMHLWGEHDRCKRSSWPKIGKCVFVSSAYWFYFSCAIFVGPYSKDKCFWVVGELVLMYSPCTLSNKEDVCLYLCAFLSILLALPVNQWRGQSEHTIAPCWPITESLNVLNNISSQMILHSIPSTLVSPHRHVFVWFRGVGCNEINSSSIVALWWYHLASLDYIWSGHKPSFERKHVSSEASFSCVRLLTLSECEFRHQTFIRPIPPQIDHEIFPSGNHRFFIFFMSFWIYCWESENWS